MSAKKQHCHISECPLANALDLFGDRWTLIIIRDFIIFNKHEYKELLESTEGISTNILSDRLKKLENENIISSIPHPEYKNRKFYYITKSGKEIAPILISLVDWAHKNLDNVPPAKGHSKCAEIIEESFKELAKWEEKYLGHTI